MAGIRRRASITYDFKFGCGRRSSSAEEDLRLLNLRRLGERHASNLQDLQDLQRQVLRLASQSGVSLGECQTENFTCEMDDACKDLVITCDPRRPPHCLPPLLVLLSRATELKLTVHVHSSVKDLPPALAAFFPDLPASARPTVSVRVIWSADEDVVPAPGQSPKTASRGAAPSLSVAGHGKMSGENTVFRYLARLTELLSSGSGEGVVRYETLSLTLVSESDAWLDDAQAWLVTGTHRGRANFVNKLGNALGMYEEYSGGLLTKNYTMTDIFVASSLAVLGRANLVKGVADWRDRVAALTSQ